MTRVFAAQMSTCSWSTLPRQEWDAVVTSTTTQLCGHAVEGSYIIFTSQDGNRVKRSKVSVSLARASQNSIWTFVILCFISSHIMFSESRFLPISNVNENTLCKGSKISVCSLDFLSICKQYLRICNWICLFIFSANWDCGKCVFAQNCVQQCAENPWKKHHCDGSALVPYPRNTWSLQLHKSDSWQDLLLWWI